MNRLTSAMLAFFGAMLAACTWTTASGPPSPTEQGSETSGLAAGAQDHSGGQDARDAGHSPDPGAFGVSCISGADCETNVCFSGGKGGFCSLKCTTDTDCPPGSAGSAPHCNPHGYCRY